jgi:hypothetical protein
MKIHVRNGGTFGTGNYNTLLNVPIINLFGSSENSFVNLAGVTSQGTYCLKGYYKYTVTSDLYYTNPGILCCVMVEGEYRIVESVILVDGRNTLHKLWYRIDDNSFIKEEFQNLEGVLWLEV